jgi:molybdate transport system ATP-binding protein
VAAKIAGLERVVGVARGGAFVREGLRLSSMDAASRALAARDGLSLAAVFRAADARLGEGAPARVSYLESTPTGVRVVLDVGAAEVSPREAVGLRPGDDVRWSIAPECVRFVPAS